MLSSVVSLSQSLKVVRELAEVDGQTYLPIFISELLRKCSKTQNSANTFNQNFSWLNDTYSDI